MIATSFLQNRFHKPDCQIPPKKFIPGHTQTSSESLKRQQNDDLQHAFNCKSQPTGSMKNAKELMQKLYAIYTEVHKKNPGTYTVYNTSFQRQGNLQAHFLRDFKLT